jgi:hypothetical protein
MNRRYKTTDRNVRKPRPNAQIPISNITRRPFDAVAFAAALEVLG